MNKISLMQGYWFKKKKMELSLPKGWKVDHCRSAADSYKKLSTRQMEEAIDSPIGCERLESIAKGKKEAIILFDDMTRPTRPARILPFILAKLHSAGMKKENIRFLVSAGSHGAQRLDDFYKKLGRDIAAEYAVYNHNCFENTAYIGRTTTGVPLYINKEFLKCDLKIAIGTVLPHLYCGFSGGGKIVVPGICGIKTIESFHRLACGDLKFASYRDNLRVKTISEAVKMTGFQFKIDFIVNTKGEEVACYAGEPVKEFSSCAKDAARAYRTPHARNYDVVIANAYIKSNEADIAIQNTIRFLNRKKGIIVLVAQNPQGQVNHYLFRSYGKFIGGRLFAIRTFLKGNMKYIVFSPYRDRSAFDTFDAPEKLIWEKSWGAILKIIKEDFNRPYVGVFYDATTQLLG